jgi:hypothetical protein
VHTLPDGSGQSVRPIADFLDAALARDVAVLGIANHDQSLRATKAVGAVGDRPLLVLPGVEVTTHLGHLVALFPPERPDDLVDFGSPGTSRSSLTSGTTAGRSSRSLLGLGTNDIESRGRLAILVHADSDEGIAASVTGTELASLFTRQGNRRARVP